MSAAEHGVLLTRSGPKRAARAHTRATREGAGGLWGQATSVKGALHEAKRARVKKWRARPSSNRCNRPVQPIMCGQTSMKTRNGSSCRRDTLKKMDVTPIKSCRYPVNC